jgi:hypothetical protein
METVFSAIASKAVGTIFDGVFGGGKSSAQPQTPGAPTVEKPVDMPTPNDAAVAAAKRKSIAGMVARQGRAASILTDQASTGATLG